MIDLNPVAVRRKRSKHTVPATAPASPPVWPLPGLNGRSPVVLDGNPKSPGVELAYRRENESDLLTIYPAGGANGSNTHFMPNLIPAYAVRDGEIIYAGKHAIVVDHRNGWATYYANLEHVFAMPTDERPRRRPEHVKAGDVLGYIGSSAAGMLKCLHFELWKRDEEMHFNPIDPSAEMRSWLVLPWTDDRLTPTESATQKRAA
ncbi:MAG TPA: M23 family metallopeptidase [Kofleriaceae bacterium]|nr:M23 family metallopeptidase [Kofleriaceae bacterium]